MTPRIQEQIAAANTYAEKHGLRTEPFTGILADEVKRLDDLVERYETSMRNLASWLGVSGYNDPNATPESLEKRIRAGVDMMAQTQRAIALYGRKM